MQTKHRTHTELEMQLMRHGWPIHNLPETGSANPYRAIVNVIKRTFATKPDYQTSINEQG